MHIYMHTIAHVDEGKKMGIVCACKQRWNTMTAQLDYEHHLLFLVKFESQ